jgi:hypothetical protein
MKSPRPAQEVLRSGRLQGHDREEEEGEDAFSEATIMVKVGRIVYTRRKEKVRSMHRPP